jgi:hypothetical protein
MRKRDAYTQERAAAEQMPPGEPQTGVQQRPGTLYAHNTGNGINLSRLI